MEHGSLKDETPRSIRRIRREKNTSTSVLSDMAKVSFLNRKRATAAETAIKPSIIERDPPDTEPSIASQNPPHNSSREPRTGAIPSTNIPDLSTDQIALSSALRMQIIQRERAKQDILKLSELREKALADPIGFMQHFTKSPAFHSTEPGIASYIATESTNSKNILVHSTSITSNGSDTDIGDCQDDDKEEYHARKKDLVLVNTSAEHKTTSGSSNFGGLVIPRPQCIYHCPKVNWEKYHVCEAPLNKIHNIEKQSDLDWKRYPQIFGASGSPQVLPTYE